MLNRFDKLFKINFNNDMLLIFRTVLYISLFLLASCSNKPIIKISGISNLEEKAKFIEIKRSNKNDILGYFGRTIFDQTIDENNWFYFETEYTKNYYGKKIILKNNVLIITFDNKSIVKNLKLLTITDLDSKINFDNQKTESFAVNSSISNRISSIIKKRLENKNK